MLKKRSSSSFYEVLVDCLDRFVKQDKKAVNIQEEKIKNSQQLQKNALQMLFSRPDAKQKYLDKMKVLENQHQLALSKQQSQASLTIDQINKSLMQKDHLIRILIDDIVYQNSKASARTASQMTSLIKQKQEKQIKFKHVQKLNLLYNEYRDLMVLKSSVLVETKNKQELQKHELILRKNEFIQKFNKQELSKQYLAQVKGLQQQIKTAHDAQDAITAQLCIICANKKRQYMANPCKHFMYCQDCYKTIKECSYCRKNIKKFVKVFT